MKINACIVVVSYIFVSRLGGGGEELGRRREGFFFLQVWCRSVVETVSRYDILRNSYQRAQTGFFLFLVAAFFFYFFRLMPRGCFFFFHDSELGEHVKNIDVPFDTTPPPPPSPPPPPL